MLLLLTLLIKARVQIATGSGLGIVLLLLQTLVFLAVGGGLVLVAGGARSTPRSSAALQRPDRLPWPLKLPLQPCNGKVAA